MVKERFQHFLKQNSASISLDLLIKITGRKLVLPFYHTVSANPQPHFSELNYFRSEKDFVTDLEFFEQNYSSVPIQQTDGRNRQFHLSFDDGMREIYDVVFPILKNRNIHATFFVTRDFVDNKKMFVSHQRSLLLHEIAHSQDSCRRVAQHLNIEKSQVKEKLLNINIESYLAEIAGLVRVDFKEYLEQHKPYLTTDQIIELKNAGFMVANHGSTHRNFNTMTFPEQKQEIETANEFLKSTGSSDFYFAFPYGDQGIKKEFFEWIFTEGKIEKSFGVSGLKHDFFPRHLHRILMEQPFSAEQIIKAEYFYYFWKAFIFRNKIRR